MFRRLRSLAFILLGAALGAAVGRLALEARQNMERGESATDIDVGRVTLRIQDVVPGLVAAFRVSDAPWSWFHIPGWLAAFAVNAGVGAVGGDITKIREHAERTVFGLAGLDARDFGFGGDSEPDGSSHTHDVNGFNAAGWDTSPASTPPGTI